MKPGEGKTSETYGGGVWNDVMRDVIMTSCVEPSREGREKRLKPTGGGEFIASFPREWAWRHAPRDWRVGMYRKCLSSTTLV